MNCPACGITQETSFEMCPKCGVIVSKFIEKEKERSEREEQRRKLAGVEKQKQQLEQQEKERVACSKALKNQKPTEKTCRYCKMKAPSAALICPYCRKNIDTSTTTKILTVFIVLLIGSCVFLNSNQVQTTKIPSPPPEPIYVSCADKINKVTSYAAILGRAVACGEDVKYPSSRVGAWVDECFDVSERPTQIVLFAAGMEMNARNQKEGKSPDTCESAISSYRKMAWPQYVSESTKKEPVANTEPGYDPKSLPYIDKAKGIDTTITPVPASPK